MNGANGVLSLLVIGLATLGVAGWNSAQWLRSTAARMMARAEALEATRVAYSAGLTHWREQHGCPREPQGGAKKWQSYSN